MIGGVLAVIERGEEMGSEDELRSLRERIENLAQRREDQDVGIEIADLLIALRDQRLEDEGLDRRVEFEEVVPELHVVKAGDPEFGHRQKSRGEIDPRKIPHLVGEHEQALRLRMVTGERLHEACRVRRVIGGGDGEEDALLPLRPALLFAGWEGFPRFGGMAGRRGRGRAGGRGRKAGGRPFPCHSPERSRRRRSSSSL